MHGLHYRTNTQTSQKIVSARENILIAFIEFIYGENNLQRVGFGWCLVWAAHHSVLTLLIITSVSFKSIPEFITQFSVKSIYPFECS